MKKFISVILSMALVVNMCLPAKVAYGKTIPAQGGSPSEKTHVATFTSNQSECEEDERDRTKLTASGHFLTVDYANSADVLEYRVALNRPGYTKVLGYEDPVDGAFYRTYYVGHVPDGRYYVMISRAKTLSQVNHTNPSKFGDGGTNRVTTVEIKNGNIYIEKYDNIMRKNQELREYENLKHPEMHLDPTLQDMEFVLTDPDTEYCNALTENEIAYIRNVTNRITAGCQTDYEKARAIYKYIGENIYYDVYCNKNDYRAAYLHPYRNLKALEEGIKKPNSTSDGKVATLCTGYSSINIAMLRSIGIPARMVFGYHLHTNKYRWDQVSEEDVRNRSSHYWTEFYYNGKWRTCDSYMAGANKWNRTSLDDPGKWVTRGFTNFGRFNPTEEQLATSHYGQGVFTRTYLGDKDDVLRLKDILMESDEDGISNLSKIGMTEEYFAPNDEYMFLGSPSIMYGESKGDKLRKINWSGKDMEFDGKLKGFEGLKWLNINNNPNIEYLSVTGDANIINVYARNCNIRNLYASNCHNLKRLYTNGNPLRYAKYAFVPSSVASQPGVAPDNGGGAGNEVVKTPHATIRTTKGGTVDITYSNGVHKLTAKSNKGYKFNGWLNGSGKRVSKKKTTTIKANASFERKASFVKLKPPAKKTSKKPKKKSIVYDKSKEIADEKIG